MLSSRTEWWPHSFLPALNSIDRKESFVVSDFFHYCARAAPTSYSPLLCELCLFNHEGRVKTLKEDPASQEFSEMLGNRLKCVFQWNVFQINIPKVEEPSPSITKLSSHYHPDDGIEMLDSRAGEHDMWWWDKIDWSKIQPQNMRWIVFCCVGDGSPNG